ncbi:MAG TPA: CPBP family glutamic-type intramembrane protease [Ktedonobacterales bacterium]
MTARNDASAASAEREATHGRWQAPPMVEITPEGQRLLVELVAPRVVAKTPLNTPRESWGWLWKDTLGRVAPLLAASWAYGRFVPFGKGDLGMRSDAPLTDLAVGVAVGLPLSQIAAVFRREVAPNYRVPSPSDQVSQSAFYFLLNAPAEELFWRGVVQSLATRGLRKVPGIRRAAGPLGWVTATATFGAYHRLGGWSWRSIAGVTAAGGLFGAMFAMPKRRSIWPVVIAHGFATAGFLSWADVALYRRAIASLRQQYATERPDLTLDEVEPAAGQ